jgi:hypothetical protein
MSLEGFVEYKRREFCNDVKCPVQMELNALKDKPDEYERVRHVCSTACKYTTWQFHHWLMEKGYVILINSKLRSGEQTVLVSVDKKLLGWIDEQVQTGKYHNRSQLIEKALSESKRACLKAKEQK